MKAKAELEKAREKTAEFISARPREVIFTSGGTEGNNLAIQGVVSQNLTPLPLSLIRRGVGERCILPHIITTNIEHPSVLDTCKMLERRGLAEVSIVSVEPNGIVDPKKIKKELKENTVLVSVMYANNEIGTVQPIREIAKEIRFYKKTNNSIYPLFHTDAVQAVNYLDLNVEKLGVDLLTISGAKIEGGGRAGVLYKKANVPLARIWGGGEQEMGFRPGTENLPEILKFAKALENIFKTREKETKRLIKLKNYFLKKLLKLSRTILDNNMEVNGDSESNLPNIINVTFPGIPSDLLVIEFSAKGIMISSKSACKSKSKEGSYVIEALRPGSDPEIGGVRFSMGKSTTKSDIDRTIKILSAILQKLSKWYG